MIVAINDRRWAHSFITFSLDRTCLPTSRVWDYTRGSLPDRSIPISPRNFGNPRNKLNAGRRETLSNSLAASSFIPLSDFCKGTFTDQDRLFSDNELKLFKILKFSPQFDTKVLNSLLHSLSLSSHGTIFFLGRLAQSKLAGHKTLGRSKKWQNSSV